MINIEEYDSQNVFAKILRNELPSNKIFENEEILAFSDINPQASVHVVVITKEKFCSFNDFSKNASDKCITSLIRGISKIAKKLNLSKGYRIICNVGHYGGQVVPHLHFHILGGERLWQKL